MFESALFRLFPLRPIRCCYFYYLFAVFNLQTIYSINRLHKIQYLNDISYTNNKLQTPKALNDPTILFSDSVWAGFLCVYSPNLKEKRGKTTEVLFLSRLFVSLNRQMVFTGAKGIRVSFGAQKVNVKALSIQPVTAPHTPHGFLCGTKTKWRINKI